jgi:hypothetical protein
MERPVLRVDEVYKNTNNWKNPDDVFNRMFKGFSDGKGIQNAGGFRYRSRAQGERGILNAAFIVLVTNFGETEWPDKLDIENGIFTYYGDNRRPGKDLHDTRIGGNRLLRQIFADLRNNQRVQIPPFLCFENLQNTNGSFMKLLGLAVPGTATATSFDDLVAVWRTYDGKRFQNYRAIFTILKEELIDWRWLDDLVQGTISTDSRFCPITWRRWVDCGMPEALRCERSRFPRSKADQLPADQEEKVVLERIFNELSDREFEYAAKEILTMLNSGFINLEVTRPQKDGGRDITGYYRIGHDKHEILLECFAEAKRWAPDSPIGVKPLSRLISRIKHRDFGIFITTSYFNTQIQQELIDDKHPVLLVSGRDIVRLLIAREIAGQGHGHEFDNWLKSIKASEAKPHS